LILSYITSFLVAPVHMFVSMCGFIVLLMKSRIA